MEIEEKKTLRVAIYLRVSTEEQAEKYGLDAQRSAIEGIIKSRGILKNGEEAATLAGDKYIYIDDGISGTIEVDQRPEFTRLKEDILNAPEGQKPFDVVAVYKIDRFARKLRILVDIVDFLEQNSIGFISATESIDTSTPFGRAMLSILGVISELERDTILERTKRGKEQAILSGVWMGANAPFGYQKNENGHLAIFDEEAEIVKTIFNYFTVDKLNPQKIADLLTRNEILSPDASAVKNKKRRGTSRKINHPHFWRSETVRSILSDDVYTGTRYLTKSLKGKLLQKDEWQKIPFKHQEIIQTHIFELAQQYLKDLSDHKTLTQKKKDNHIYLLSGLLKCDHCRTLEGTNNSEIISWTGGKDKISSEPIKYSYHYQCNRKNLKKFSVICPVVPIPAEPLEEYVVNFIKKLLSDPQAVYEYQKQLTSSQLNTRRLEVDKKQFQRLFNALPQRKNSLLEQHEMGAISSEVFKKKLYELKTKEKEYTEKINSIDYQLSQVTLSKGYETSFNLYSEKYGKSLDEVLINRDKLYELIHMLIHKIIIYSRPKTDKDVIAGRKKENQFIPERVDIYFNLPQNLLRQLYTHKFGLRSDNL